MKRSTYVCQLCINSIKASRGSRPLPQRFTAPNRTQYRYIQSATLPFTPSSNTVPAKSRPVEAQQFWGSDWTIFSVDNAALVKKAQTFGNEVLQSRTAPSEEAVLKAFEVIRYAALQLASTDAFKSISQQKRKDFQETKRKSKCHTDEEQTPDFVADILSMDQSKANPVSVSIAVDLLSSLAYEIVKHPPVFITAEALSKYVDIQTTLHRTSTLPEIFDLYAYKPVPTPDTDPVQYKNPSPNRVSQAVPKNVADKALDDAIHKRDLGHALDIISSTYAMSAFRRNRFVRKALPAITGLSLTPLAALPIAKAWASTSLVADPEALTAYVFFGILTYVSSVTGMGYIAVTTHNDQMERVTWMKGTPLRSRWLREDERAALDKVALAWGFKENDRRGLEEGPEWDTLRIWCGRKGMVLDAPELMEGME